MLHSLCCCQDTPPCLGLCSLWHSLAVRASFSLTGYWLAFGCSTPLPADLPSVVLKLHSLKANFQKHSRAHARLYNLSMARHSTSALAWQEQHTAFELALNVPSAAPRAFAWQSCADDPAC